MDEEANNGQSNDQELGPVPCPPRSLCIHGGLHFMELRHTWLIKIIDLINSEVFLYRFLPVCP